MNDRVQKIKKALSYTELQTFKAVYHELQGNNGIVVVSKVMEKIEASKSIAVNCIKKLEMAGLIETRSLGMKGTYIELLDKEALKELAE